MTSGFPAFRSTRRVGKRILKGAAALALLAGVGLSILLWSPGLPVDFRDLLQNSPDLELVALGNESRSPETLGPDSYEFRPILGTVHLQDQVKSELLAKVDGQIRWARLCPVSANCHYPHHLIRSLKAKSEISLCFQCGNFYAHKDGKLVVGGSLSGSKDYYDAVLARSGVPVPPVETF